MNAIEYQTLLLNTQELLMVQKMNFVSVYLALIVAIHFVGNRVHTYLLASVIALFTLYSAESFRHYFSLIDQAGQVFMAAAQEFGDSMPILLQRDAAFTIFGYPLGMMFNFLIFTLGWISVVVFAIYKKRNGENVPGGT